MSDSELAYNWPIIGHQNIKDFLQTAIRNQSMAQSFLFSGPSKVGKTLTAKYFAKSLLCEEYKRYQSGESIKAIVPCGQCSACQQFDKKTYADLYFVEREVNEKTEKKKAVISVGQIRELIEKISKRSFLNSYKIVIIPEAESMTVEASNCLLKTLEEPSSQTIIILITKSQEQILPTILSRCQKFNFLPVTRDNIYDYLIQQGAGRDEAIQLAKMSVGRPTVAMKMYEKKDNWQDYQTQAKELLQVMCASADEKFKFIEKFAKKSKENREYVLLLNQLSSLARDLLMQRIYKKELISNAYLMNEFEAAQKKYSWSGLQSWCRELEEAKDLIYKNINGRLLLENLLLNI